MRPSEPRQQAIEVPLPSDDDDDLEIQRGGSMMSVEPATSARARLDAPADNRPSLELAATPSTAPRRHAPPPRLARGPSTSERVLAWGVPLALFVATAVALAKVAHRPERSVLALAPHAFDGSSLAQSGGGAALLLVFAIAAGYVGFRLEPRSYVLVGAAAALLLASVAMVTIALVATEEHAVPPDGALLMPYLIPLALALIGLAIVLRGPLKYLDDARAQAIAAGFAGGSLVFTAIELSGKSLF